MSESEDTSHEAMSATAPRWNRRQSLDLVHQLNEHCLELLAGVAAADAGSELPLVSANRDLWAQLRPEARKRAALLPFVIVDLYFADVSFAMRSTVAAMIGQLTPGQVRAIASRVSRDIHVRWEQNGCFWRELLFAAESGNDEAIAELHLHAKLQLLGPLVDPHQ